MRRSNVGGQADTNRLVYSVVKPSYNQNALECIPGIISRTTDLGSKISTASWKAGRLVPANVRAAKGYRNGCGGVLSVMENIGQAPDVPAQKCGFAHQPMYEGDRIYNP